MRDNRYNTGFGSGMATPAVRTLLIITSIVFGLQLVLSFSSYAQSLFIHYLALTPIDVLTRFHVWQPVTYMFLHSPGNLFHFGFNMLGLWMFGTSIEQKMGTSRFMKFYFFCGIGAGLSSFLFFPAWGASTLGASGAIFGLLTAYAMYYPDNLIYIYMVIPIKAKYLVLIYGVMEIMSMSSSSNIAHYAHVGGAIMGYIFIKFNLWSGAAAARPRAPRSATTPPPPKPGRTEAVWKRVDEILDKVNREGLHKLTRAEKQFLSEMSTRRRSE